jgi:hypothetical protein
MSDTSTDPNQLTAYQGKTFRVSFQVSDGSQPQSLAGYGATFQILQRAGGTVVLEVDDTMTGDSLDAGNADVPVAIEPNGQTGLVQVRLGADQTATLTKSGVYDCSIYSKTDSTEVQLLAGGPLSVILIGGE